MALTFVRFTLLLLVIPAYFMALSRRWWATIPLWLISTAVMLTQLLMGAQQGIAFGSESVNGSFIYVGEMTKIMLIPMAVQFVAVVRGLKIGAGSRQSHGSRELVEAFEPCER
jgi:multisubunit Na+/H+ antiporter MnhC subunit